MFTYGYYIISQKFQTMISQRDLCFSNKTGRTLGVKYNAQHVSPEGSSILLDQLLACRRKDCVVNAALLAGAFSNSKLLG